MGKRPVLGLVGLCWVGLALSGCERGTCRDGCCDKGGNVTRNQRGQGDGGATAAGQRYRTLPDQSIAGRGSDQNRMTTPYNFDPNNHGVPTPAGTGNFGRMAAGQPAAGPGPALPDSGAAADPLAGRTSVPPTVSQPGMMRAEKNVVPAAGQDTIVNIPTSSPRGQEPVQPDMPPPMKHSPPAAPGAAEESMRVTPAQPTHSSQPSVTETAPGPEPVRGSSLDGPVVQPTGPKPVATTTPPAGDLPPIPDMPKSGEQKLPTPSTSSVTTPPIDLPPSQPGSPAATTPPQAPTGPDVAPPPVSPPSAGPAAPPPPPGAP